MRSSTGLSSSAGIVPGPRILECGRQASRLCLPAHFTCYLGHGAASKIYHRCSVHPGTRGLWRTEVVFGYSSWKCVCVPVAGDPGEILGSRQGLVNMHTVHLKSSTWPAPQNTLGMHFYVRWGVSANLSASSQILFLILKMGLPSSCPRPPPTEEPGNMPSPVARSLSLSTPALTTGEKPH